MPCLQQSVLPTNGYFSVISLVSSQTRMVIACTENCIACLFSAYLWNSLSIFVPSLCPWKKKNKTKQIAVGKAELLLVDVSYGMYFSAVFSLCHHFSEEKVEETPTYRPGKINKSPRDRTLGKLVEAVKKWGYVQMTTAWRIPAAFWVGSAEVSLFQYPWLQEKTECDLTRYEELILSKAKTKNQVIYNRKHPKLDEVQLTPSLSLMSDPVFQDTHVKLLTVHART